MKDFRQLNIWKIGIEIVRDVYLLCNQLPPHERYGLVSQMTRAAASVPANIAEGSSRTSDKDNARFIQIALGSAFELQSYLVITRELQLVSLEETNQFEARLLTQIKMMHAFLRKLIP
ncbi:MAG TPA: four helix bundle protein [Chitinophagales bacterium]|nr:four helix bundle protein [Chitinophagales bacterium]